MSKMFDPDFIKTHPHPSQSFKNSIFDTLFILKKFGIFFIDCSHFSRPIVQKGSSEGFH